MSGVTAAEMKRLKLMSGKKTSVSLQGGERAVISGHCG